MKTFCVVTGTRADFGLLSTLISVIDKDPDTEYKLVCMGTHFSSEYGNTYREIEASGAKIHFRCDMLLSSTSPAAVAKSFGLAVISIGDYFTHNQFDAVVILGDRYEALAIATIALISGLPIVHLCGGEVTSGAIDDSMRHAITKMASIHCVANKTYANRIIQLGESIDTVHIVGGLGVDNISLTSLLSRQELEQQLDFRFLERNLLITYHPVTNTDGNSADEFRHLLQALSNFPDMALIFTMPNADTNSDTMWQLLTQYTNERENSMLVKSLGKQRYFSMLKVIDGVVGNSSSGISEVPSFKKPTINIGERQNGRIFASSVICCEPEYTQIVKSIEMMYSTGFQEKLASVHNPYGEPGAANKILNILKSTDFTKIKKCKFNDLDFET